MMIGTKKQENIMDLKDKLTAEQRDWIMNKLEVLCDSTLTLGGVFCGMEEALTAHTEPEGQQTGIRGMDKQAILDAWLDKAVMMYGEKGNLMIADAYNILSSILTAQEGEIWPKTVDGTDGSQTYRKPAQEDELSYIPKCHDCLIAGIPVCPHQDTEPEDEPKLITDEMEADILGMFHGETPKEMHARLEKELGHKISFEQEDK